MFETFAKSYEYVNGTCVFDDVVESSTESCSAVDGTAVWIVGLI